MRLRGNYLNEKVTIIKETNEEYEIKFDDGFTEFVPKSAVTILPKQKARTRIKPSNPKRRKENFKKYYGSIERVKLLNATPCLICSNLPSDAAHTVSKSAGGTFTDLLPLCRTHHSQLHNLGTQTFEKLHNIKLTELAKEFAKILP